MPTRAAAAAAPAAPTSTLTGAKLKVPKVIADKVQWINENVEVQEKLRLGAVARSLIEVGKDSALDILERLVADIDNAGDDPNSWVVEAAANYWEAKAKEKEARIKAEAEGADWEASMALLDLDEGETLPAVAAEVEKKSEALETLHKLNERGVLQEGAVKRLKPLPAEKIDAFESHFKLLGQVQSKELVDKLCKKALKLERPLEWLDNQSHSSLGEVLWAIAHACSSGTWEQPLDPVCAKSVLRGLPEERALAILKGLQGRAKRVANPLCWLRQEARRLRMTMLPEDTIRKIKQLNGSGGLRAQLNVTRVKPFLFKLSKAKQLEVLEYLKKRATEWKIADPNTFVEQACERAQEEEAASKTLPEASTQRVAWLNENVELSEQLDIERLRAPLCLLQEEQQAEVLDLLKSGAADIADPNDFIIRECRRLAKQAEAEDKAGTKRKRPSEEENWEEEQWDEDVPAGEAWR